MDLKGIIVLMSMAIWRSGGLPGSYYGNEVIERYAYLPSGARKSWVVDGVPLVAGEVEEFSFYVMEHDASCVIWLQVWEKTDASHSYVLQWQTAATISAGDSRVNHVEVASSETYLLKGNGHERLGFTYEQDYGVISFAYDLNQHTYFLSNNMSLPVLNQEYTFDEFPLPAVFSIAVKILSNDQDKMQANYFGNEVVLRNGYFSAEAQKSWLLYDTELDDGILQEIRFYVHDIAENVSHSLWVQIWEGTDDPYLFILKWQKYVQIAAGVKHTIFNVPVYGDESYKVKQRHILGFTNEDEVGVISFSYQTGQQVLYRSTYGEVPFVEEQYIFYNRGVPFIFSIDAKIGTTDIGGCGRCLNECMSAGQVWEGGHACSSPCLCRDVCMDSRCEEGFICQAEVVQCSTIPCPPVPKCVEKDTSCGQDDISGCPTGRYGSDCLLSCPAGCKNCACHRSAGYCMRGCQGGYHGEFCDNTCREEDCWTYCMGKECITASGTGVLNKLLNHIVKICFVFVIAFGVY